MARDIERIIDDLVIPEMEYAKPKRKTVSYEVPEIVLPKTKAEMYEEAKGRLKQKTTAASKAYTPGKKRSAAPKPAEPKTVELETAAAAAVGSASNFRSSDRPVRRVTTLRRIVENPKWVGGADELVPFAWRNPLVEVSRPSKYYKATLKAERAAYLLPVPKE